jgi:ABC-type Fe3+ transport system substrate-binding protein
MNCFHYRASFFVKYCIFIFGAVFIQTPPSASQEKLVILSPHWEGIKREFERGFNAYLEYKLKLSLSERPSLQWIDVGGTSDILKFIRSEFEKTPHSIGVDLMFGGGVDPYIELTRRNFLEPYSIGDQLLDEIPQKLLGIPLYDAQFRWYSAMLAGFGIVYNKALLKRLALDEPKTWEDLTAEKNFSWVSLADPRKSGSVHLIYEIILQSYGWSKGWEILYALAINARNFNTHSTQVIKDLSVGEAAFGFCIDSQVKDAIQQIGDENIGFIIPAERSAFVGDSVAIIKGAPSRKWAEHFINYVLSSDAQQMLMKHPGEASPAPSSFVLSKLSVRPDTYETLGIEPTKNPFKYHSDFLYDSVLASKRWSLINDLIGTFLIDEHKNLKQLRTLENDKDRKLLTPPIREEEALNIIQQSLWEDQTYRQKTIQLWKKQILENYPDVLKNRRSFLRFIPVFLTLFVCGMIVLKKYKR